ncbi:MAG: HEAT repeat domain-containing protein [Anaerolineae bacterium]|nr:HEAT repeat domain-containing protein [Anaerolineae bacterium]
MLIRALQQGEPNIRGAAADTLGKIGYVPALKPLYLALRDREPAVRDGVFRALENLQMRVGASLPGVF